MTDKPAEETKTQGPPEIAGLKPAVLELEPGRYTWCSCGHSKEQPFCDSSHKDPACGTDRRPYRFQVAKKLRLALCQCKHTSSRPFCDRSHTKLNPNE